ncbi:MAG: ornithine carbamoyltransferase [Methanomicrobiales archaeon]|nr:ornithine carbamoyltransferase [Methanomicrobiales archaeon]MBS1195069.1 ornithine carbamoyltransferase [Methanomicrobia archaeon]MDD1648480.1 ornithine carbamoyltransferase [Methanomicrobiales archaeon]
MTRDLLSIRDLTEGELRGILDEAEQLKELRKKGISHPLLAGKSLGMIFEKSSTRTRVSFEVGMYELGGHALFLNPRDLQLGRGEEIRDTARVLSRYVQGVMIRAYHHSTLEEYARYSAVPIINGLSNREHPCQVLADLLTLRERFGSLEGIRVAWIGDGNNVCHSLILSAALTGIRVTVATPPDYRPDPGIVAATRKGKGKVTLTRDPAVAVKDADAVYTDVWVSMGEEEERARRLQAFQGYTITETLLSSAADRAIVLHCLPAHRGEEITDGVLEGPASAVWDQAENRLHAQKALLVRLLGGASPEGRV